MEQFATTNSSSSSKRRPTTGPLRLSLQTSSVPRPNYNSFDQEWHLQSSPLLQQQQQQQQQHQQQYHHHGVGISAPSNGYGTGATYSNFEEATMWQNPMIQSHTQGADVVPRGFPERPNEPDCVYYIRTGQCAYGMDCKFNHPPDRNMATSFVRDNGEYPERIGQPECQYYMKTGICKFGSTCKFHHPKERLERISTNALGFPLREGEKDCPYYMRTGSCKFAATCKFNHPEPAGINALMTVTGSSAYPSNVSAGAPSPHPFPTGVASWSLPRAQYVPSSRFQRPSNFTPLIVQPQNMVSVPGWSPYQARMGPVTSLDAQQSPLGRANLIYGTASSNNEASSGSIHSSYNSYVLGSAATGFPSAIQSNVISKEAVFPERPGQLDCHYYMKTGDCKYGMTCRFNHPKERASALPNCTLSPLGLPLRQGATQCAFYMQYGTCKYGSTCKFDHPITNNLTYSSSTSSLTELTLTPYPVGMSVATFLPALNNGAKMMYPKVVSNRNTDKQQQVYDDDSFGDDNGDGSNGTRSGTAGSNRSSSADSLDMRGHESIQVATNMSASS